VTAVRTPGPVLILTQQDAAILVAKSNISQVRSSLRGRDEAAYQVFRTVWETALSYRDSVEGKVAALPKEKRQAYSRITTDDLAKQVGVTARTIRNDIASGVLPALKKQRVWTISTVDAELYLAARRPN
jgi:hypothetical protein